MPSIFSITLSLCYSVTIFLSKPYLKAGRNRMGSSQKDRGGELNVAFFDAILVVYEDIGA